MYNQKLFIVIICLKVKINANKHFILNLILQGQGLHLPESLFEKWSAYMWAVKLNLCSRVYRAYRNEPNNIFLKSLFSLI